MLEEISKKMTFYSKSDLIYEDYAWTEYSKEDPKISGKLDVTPFYKREGNEVLYFVNTMAQLHSLTLKSDGKKMEMMIHNHLPMEMKSQENVKNWVMKNWKYH